jgi:hypothetical protein
LRRPASWHTHAHVSGPNDSVSASRDSQRAVSWVGASGAPSIEQAGRARARQSGATRVTGHSHTPRSGSQVPNSAQPAGHGLTDDIGSGTGVLFCYFEPAAALL